MQPMTVVADPATAHGLLLVAALFLPVGGVLLSLLLGGRAAERIALGLLPVGLAVAMAITVVVLQANATLVYVLGGWQPPLGVALRADGLSAAMLLTTAVVICGVGLFARAEFRTPAGVLEARRPFAFWILLLGVWAAMNAVFLGDDLFNLFVALELVTFAAVPLVSLDGRAETVAAALRYLLFALLGSVLYLLGVALFYGAYGTLDIVLLSGLVRPEPVVWIAAALMVAGLAAKTALFPLHLWLPPAHAGAPAAGSAVLSALVVKASFFIIVRIWFDVLPEVPKLAAAQILATFGAAAILFGGVLALRQERLKMVVAYSTVAQIGYLFLIFPLVTGSALVPGLGTGAWTGGMLQLVSHALAKAAMFMAAGLIAQALGHDRVAGLGGVGHALPVTVFALGLSGLSLMGLPPSGGFAAKWLLTLASIQSGQWWWGVVMLLGGLFTGAYMFRILAQALGGRVEASAPLRPVATSTQAIVLALALCSVALGLVPIASFHLVQVGRVAIPVGMIGD